MYEISTTIWMLRHLFKEKDIFLLFVIFLTFLVSLILTIRKFINKAITTSALATILLIILKEKHYKKHRFNNLKKIVKIFQNCSSTTNPTIPIDHDLPKPQKTPKSSQKSQSFTRTSFQENCFKFKERHASLSEPLITTIRHAPLSEAQYKPTNIIYPSLQNTP